MEVPLNYKVSSKNTLNSKKVNDDNKNYSDDQLETAINEIIIGINDLQCDN